MPYNRRNKPRISLSLLLISGLIILFLTPITTRSAMAEKYILVEGRQGRFDRTRLEYFRGNIPVGDFYNYYKSRPNTGYESPQSCLLIPYRAPSGRSSLIVIMGDPGSYTEGAGKLTISGLSESAQLLLKDDPPNLDQDDEYHFNPPVARFNWVWGAGFADGAIIRDLAESPDLSLDFESLDNVEEIRILTGEPENPHVLSLNPDTKVNLRGIREDLRPLPQFSIGGYVDVGQKLTFDATEATARTGKIIQYEWDFDGDGHFGYASQKPVANHSFSEAGNHSVTLRVTDNSGNSAVKEKKVVASEAPLEARRKLSSSKIPPGESVRCAIDVKAKARVSGVGVEESIPDGWKVNPRQENRAVFKSSTNQWLLPEMLRPGETRRISFNLESPSPHQLNDGDLDRELDLSGEISSANPEFNGRIRGDSNLTLTRSIDPIVALSHYDVNDKELDFSLPGRISDDQIGAAVRSWQTGESLPGITEDIGFNFIKKALVYHQKGINPDAEFSQVKGGDPHVFRNIRTGLPEDLLFLDPESPQYVEAEDAVEFEVEIEVKPGGRTLMGVGLEEELPEGWEVKPKRSEGLAYKPSTNQWVITRPILPGEKFTVSYTVRVPLDEATGTFRVSGVLSESWSGRSYGMGGDDSLELTTVLPIEAVISRWNTETGKLDMEMDNYISESQSKKAIELWVEDRPVPYTGGKRLNFDDIRKIISYQLEKTPVGRF